MNARKQKFNMINADLHTKRTFLGAHLSKELREKEKTRSISLKKGDEVKVMRGQYKGKTGKVMKVDTKETKIFVEGINLTKKDGSISLIPLRPSNLMIINLEQRGKNGTPKKN